MSDDVSESPFGFQLAGFMVSRCLVDFGFTLDFSRGRELSSLRIDEPFELNMRDVVFHCDAANEREALGPALTLFRHRVEAVWIADDDTLHIMFDGELSLTIPRDPDFESWTLNGPAGELIVAGPGSRLSMFGPQRTAEQDGR